MWTERSVPITHAPAIALALTVAIGSAVSLMAGEAEDEAAIRDIWQNYSAARVGADADLYLSLWDEGGFQMVPGGPVRDKADMVASASKAFVPGAVKTMTVIPQEIEVAGDWAYSLGVFDTDRVEDGKDVRYEGKFMTILKRQADGSWKIYRDIMNFND